MHPRMSERPLVRQPHAWGTVFAWACFGVSVFLAALLWVQMVWEPIPRFGNSDQWTGTPQISQQPFVQAVLEGHNRVPTYIQNALIWIDYHWLDYQVALPRLFVFVAWPLGTWWFLLVLRRSRLPDGAAPWVTSFAIALWTAFVNRDNLVQPWRAMESTGIWLLFSVAVALLLRFRADVARREDSERPPWLWFLAASACAWTALYLHGGFALLPIILVLAAASDRRSRSLLLAAGLILAVFLWHYHGVHTMPLSRRGQPLHLGELLFGYLISMSSLVYVIALPYVGAQVAATATVVTSAVALLTTTALGWRLVRRRASDAEVVSLAMLLYAATLTLAIVVVGVRFRGWRDALSVRYLSYSIYTLIGLCVAASTFVADRATSGTRRRVLQFGALAVFGVLSAAAWRSDLQHVERYRQEELLASSAAIPITLDPWTPPDQWFFANRYFAESARLSRDAMVRDGKFLFATDAFASFDRLRRERTMGAASTCPGRFAVAELRDVPAAPPGLVEVRFTWREFGSAVSTMFALADEAGHVSGWAPGPGRAERRTGLTAWMDWFIRDGGRLTFRGYLRLPAGERGVRIAPVGGDGRVMCVSDVLGATLP